MRLGAHWMPAMLRTCSWSGEWCRVNGDLHKVCANCSGGDGRGEVQLVSDHVVSLSNKLPKKCHGTYLEAFIRHRPLCDPRVIRCGA